MYRFFIVVQKCHIKNLLIQRIDYNINDFQINTEDTII